MNRLWCMLFAAALAFFITTQIVLEPQTVSVLGGIISGALAGWYGGQWIDDHTEGKQAKEERDGS